MAERDVTAGGRLMSKTNGRADGRRREEEEGGRERERERERDETTVESESVRVRCAEHPRGFLRMRQKEKEKEEEEEEGINCIHAYEKAHGIFGPMIPWYLQAVSHEPLSLKRGGGKSFEKSEQGLVLLFFLAPPS